MIYPGMKINVEVVGEFGVAVAVVFVQTREWWPMAWVVMLRQKFYLTKTLVM